MKLITLSILLILIALTGCSSDDPATPILLADVDSYLASLPAWDVYSPPRTASDEQIDDPVDSSEEINGTTYNCMSTRYSMTQTPEKIVTLNPDVEVLYVGSLLQGNGYVGGIGTLAELPIRQRAPLDISIDLLTGNNTRTVANPDLASVTQAVGELIQAASDAGHRAGSRIFYQEIDYHTLEEAALKVGFSAAYSGVTVKGELEASSSVETSSVMVAFTQQMFTVSQVLPQTPGEMFSDSFSDAQLQTQIDAGRIGPGNLPVFVSSIVYGRMLVFTMTATASASEIRSTLSIAAGDIGGELSPEQSTLLETAEIGIVAVGGDAVNAEALIRTGDFSAYFEEDAALTTARPISYTVRNLADNSVASVSETTEYNVLECAAEQTGAIYKIELIDISYVQRSICGVVPFCQILFRSDFWVEDDYHTNKAVDIQTQDLMCVGDSHPFPQNSTLVKLHNDGRADRVRIYGDAWTDYPSHIQWSPGIVHANSMTEGIKGASRWSVAGCHRFAIRYRVTKTGVLTD